MKQARIRVWLLALTDVVCVAAIFLLTAYIYREIIVRYTNGDGYYSLVAYVKLLPMLLVFLACNALIRLYHGNIFYPGAMLPPQEELRRMTFSVTMTYLLLTASLLLVREQNTSRFVLLVSWLISCLLAIPARNITRWFMKKCNIGQMPLLIAGAGKGGCEMANLLKNDAYYGWNVVGFIDDDPAKPGDGSVLPRLGGINDIIPLAKEKHYAYLLCCLPLNVIQANFRLWLTHFSHITVMPTNQVLPGAWVYPTNMMCRSGLEVRNQLMMPGPRVAKILLEVVVSFIGIVCLLPLFLILALLVKLTSRGPAIYKAKRLGLNGKTIFVYKFRTMRKDAEKILQEMLDGNPDLKAEWQKNFKLENDPRITPVGNFLRKTSLDELPQLFNVLCGDMAMIGPRPIVEKEVAYYGNDYEILSRVKPGITGLWQVSGRSDTTYEQRVRFDLAYIMNWSIWLDIYILFRTVAVVLLRKGAK